MNKRCKKLGWGEESELDPNQQFRECFFVAGCGVVGPRLRFSKAAWRVLTVQWRRGERCPFCLKKG